jgi:toxin ParE1/3/4
MRIRWTPAAAADLKHIQNYLQEHYPHLAQSTVLKLYNGIRSLKTSPHRGRIGREEGTRELVFAPLPYIAGLPGKRHDD